MTDTSQDFVEFVKEQLGRVPGVSARRLFGGVGFAADGAQFAMIIGNVLYFVVDGITRPAYEQKGSRCFAYDTKKRRVEVRSYYEVPAEWLEDRERMALLAGESLQIARKKKKKEREKETKEKSKAR